MKTYPLRFMWIVVATTLQFLNPAIHAASPPTANLVGWLKADAGVTTSDGVKVSTWADQASGAHGASTAVGAPTLASRTFANGSHPVIDFDGASGLTLENPADFNLSEISVYVVGGLTDTAPSQEFVAHWSGWAFGISDGLPGRVKWVSNEPFDSFEPAPALLTKDLPYILTGTFLTGGEKRLYVNGALAGSTPFVKTGPYAADIGVAVGMLLKNGGQFLKGYIAEILVYSTVSAEQRASVEAYLNEKYVAPRPPLANLKLWLRADEGVVSSDGTIVETWEDQGGNVLNNGVADGTPTLTTSVFPNGPHPTIAFDGASGFVCDNVNDLDIPEISLYVVASIDTSFGGGAFLANLREPFGFALEVNPSAPGELNFYTGVQVVPGTANLSGGLLENNVPALITATFQKPTGGGATDDIKTIYVGGTQVARVTGAGLNNATGNRLTVGRRGGAALHGEIAEILAYSSVSLQQQQEVELYLRLKYFGSGTGPAIVLTHPKSQEVAELSSVTFSVVADGAPPLNYEWRRNGVAIPGANQAVYTINEVRRAQAGEYTVVVGAGAGPSKTSNAAVLTVIPDDTKPTLLSADRDFAVATQVNLTFSERVDVTTAANKANYAIQPAVTISAAQVSSDGKSVVLTTSAIQSGTYTVTVNNIADVVGNLISPNSQLSFDVEDGLVPVKNLKLWLRADAGVITSDEEGKNVDRWLDQAPGLKNDGVPFVPSGPPQLSEMQFPTGAHPVMAFGLEGGSGFRNDNPQDLRDTEMTIYVVGSVSELGASRIFIGNYVDVAGWGLGISDGTGGRLKWFTAPPNSMEPAGAVPAGADLEVDVPYLITADYSKLNGGIKRLFIDGAAFDSTELLDPNVAARDVTLGYAGNTVLTVGVLSNTGQRLRGTIAELLVYGSVDANQRAAVEGYLNRKYFGGGSGAPVIVLNPQSKSVPEFGPVTFEVSVSGSSPFAYKWFKDGVEIPGAVGGSYSISSVLRSDAGNYTVRVDNPDGSKLSEPAVLTVTDLDVTPPTLVAAKQSAIDSAQILVQFSERLDAATAATAANYAIQGVVVASVTLGVTPDSVILSTTPSLAPGQTYTLKVNRVADRALNPIAPDSSISVRVVTPFVGDPPPSADRVLWLKADDGVIADDSSRVIVWNDQEGGDNNANANVTSPLAPKLGEYDFPAGSRPVLNFDGASGLFLENPQNFDLANISIYVVAGVNNSVASQEFIAHWPGWAFGISDGAPGRVKWVTHGPDASLEPNPGGNLPNLTPSLLTGTYATGGDKHFYVNGELVGSAALAGLTLEAPEVAVGMLFKNGAQFLTGYIAEILIYSTVSDPQRAAVEQYLQKKYLSDPTRILITTSGNNIILTWSDPGMRLQEAPSLTGPWSDVGGAASPHSVATTQSARFYRTSR